ncbi:hypothetical protein ACJZ2D_006605 [Fusarium nematophilum]
MLTAASASERLARPQSAIQELRIFRKMAEDDARQSAEGETEPGNSNASTFPVSLSRDVPISGQEEICEQIVSEIFARVAITRDESPACFRACVNALVSGRLLEATSFAEYQGLDPMMKFGEAIMSLSANYTDILNITEA